MSTTILGLIDNIYANRANETMDDKRRMCLEFSKELLNLDGTDFLKMVTNLVSNEEKSNKFFSTLAQALILSKGDKCDKRLLLIDRLLTGSRNIMESVLSPILAILLWIYLTRALCTVSSIPKCHLSSDDLDNSILRPEYDGIEQILLRICSRNVDLLNSDSFNLYLHEDDLSSSAILGANKLKLFKQNRELEKKHKFVNFVENFDRDNHFNSPIGHKDQTILVQICILIIYKLNFNNTLTYIWIILGLCSSLSNQELIPIDLTSINFEKREISGNESKIRINLEDDTLIILCKLIGRCLFSLSSTNHNANIKKIIYEKIRSTLTKVQKRSICEVMPYSSSFISSYIVLIERILNR
ncbi:uncharacterized protein cubi_00021 [Cryptosporidium ubiquitum]|uniref:Uncharacterized protein n=1 Tax=Cryptosporidium ubiquitum TaxID=857276 RepID=A0A1J4MN59_9CRYT|nr:uncharacterized protein cubi_00021 [Cryptosporidium ubiquitum]OII74468.1 hypothetical protein cubi_00021 [Cryptosporidium ubiquitum]